MQFLSLDAHGEKGGAKIGVATANVTVDETAGDISKESSDDRDAVLTSSNLAGKSLSSCTVESVVETACGVIVECVAEIDVFRFDSLSWVLVFEQCKQMHGSSRNYFPQGICMPVP